MAKIYCENQNKKRKVNISRIHKIIRFVLKELKKEKFDLSLIFVSNQKIRAVNRKYLNKDRATDVIAFGYGINAPGTDKMEKYMGDIVVSSDRAFQICSKYDTTFFDELTLYVVHGILHLSGYNDTTASERKEIRRKEYELLQKIKKSV